MCRLGGRLTLAQRPRDYKTAARTCTCTRWIEWYKDPGWPAQLGIRDWAGLKGHIDDRNLAFSLASEGPGRSEAPRGRLGAAQTGTVLSFFS